MRQAIHTSGENTDSAINNEKTESQKRTAQNGNPSLWNQNPQAKIASDNIQRCDSYDDFGQMVV
jgi:hypothetical protein